jgi:DNA-binding response OmpR family regulator
MNRARVLVVDDEPSLAELIAYVLRMRGYDVTVVHDGSAALEAAEREPPDVAILDVMLPQVDGREVARRMRANKRLRHICILMMSSAEEHDVDWRGAGADSFLQKVFSVRRLPELVEETLERRRRTIGVAENRP